MFCALGQLELLHLSNKEWREQVHT